MLRTSQSRAVAVVSLILLTLSLYPNERQLLGDFVHSGIAPGGLYFPFYGALALGLAGLLLYRSLAFGDGFPSPPLAWCFAGLCVLLYVGFWPHTDEVTGGLIHLTTMLAAWTVGAHYAPRVFSDSRSVHTIAKVILGITTVQLTVSVAQRIGISINPVHSAEAGSLGSRANGLFNHPSKLAYLMFLLLVLGLGMLGDAEARTRRLLYWAGSAATLTIGLTESRAGAVALVTLLLVWPVVAGKVRSRALRWLMPLVVIIGLAPVAGSLMERWRQDPYGGPRAALKATAYEQIAMRPLTGLGPNSYVSVVSGYDGFVAAGYPVHNVYLLSAAELGIPAALLFYAPFLALAVAAVMSRRRQTLAGSFSVAVLAAVPGTYVITANGWGMLIAATGVTWFFVAGMAYGSVRLRPTLWPSAGQSSSGVTSGGWPAGSVIGDDTDSLPDIPKSARNRVGVQ